MTQYTTKGHIIRAALEGICYQTREVNFFLSYFIVFNYFFLEVRLLMQCMMIVVYVFQS